MRADPSYKQTQSFLMRRFREAGIRPQKKLGQNFLVDGNLQQLLVRTARLRADDVVLEIGTGTGSLTALMAAEVAVVLTVELDRHLFQLAAAELHPLENVRMLHLDVLKNKNHLNPTMIAAVTDALATAGSEQFKLVANLPFNIATPVLTNLLAEQLPVQMMIVTIQKELADRIVAQPGKKDYGALSIWMQSQCRVEIVRVMPPSVFWPRPKVTSAIVQITLDERLRRRIADWRFFHQFVRSMFFHRRKFLRSELLSGFKNRLDKPRVDRIMAELGLDGTARAEQLHVETMLALSEAVRVELGD